MEVPKRETSGGRSGSGCDELVTRFCLFVLEITVVSRGGQPGSPGVPLSKDLKPDPH
jgi:hypothetical protein